MSSSDRQDVQNEIKQLTTEIDRVAETTKFNETYLLKGDPNSTGADKTEYLSFKDAGFGKYVKAEDLDKSDSDYGKKVKITMTAPAVDDEIDIDGKHYTVISGSTSDEANNKLTVADAQNKMLAEINKANKIGATEAWTDISSWGDIAKRDLAQVKTSKDLSLSLHVGADADFENKISFNVERMDSKGLGIKGISVTGNTPARATYAIDSIEAAIKSVSQQRSGLGAIQNRLEHTIKNLDNVVENTTAAESAIRDTDMASEMVRYSNNNILMQAGQSMLAQANQTNQGVLSLLR